MAGCIPDLVPRLHTIPYHTYPTLPYLHLHTCSCSCIFASNLVILTDNTQKFGPLGRRWSFLLLLSSSTPTSQKQQLNQHPQQINSPSPSSSDITNNRPSKTSFNNAPPLHRPLLRPSPPRDSSSSTRCDARCRPTPATRHLLLVLLLLQHHHRNDNHNIIRRYNDDDARTRNLHWSFQRRRYRSRNLQFDFCIR